VAERGENLVGFGETAGLLLRKHDTTVGDDVELTLVPGGCPGSDPGLFDRGRETRGPAVVAASGRAVQDLDGHSAEPTGAILP
jgi:hypothetical protein